MITNPTSARIVYLDPLRLQYRELLELRERVREAEAAAAPKTATDKIDWQALHKPVVMVNVEARQASSSPFVFRRANLVRVP